MNSESKKILIERYVFGKENFLIQKYIVDGPISVKDHLGLLDEDWQVVFDYLVFEENLLYKCITTNIDFFKDTYIKFGTAHVREVLGISHDKYDIVWEVLFDFISIVNEALYYHVLEHREKYTTALKARGSDFVRKVLGVWKPKYEENWAKILDFLLNSVCDSIFSQNTFDHSLKAFSLIMNGTREHRPIYRHGLL
jgi:hypothetical protein